MAEDRADRNPLELRPLIALAVLVIVTGSVGLVVLERSADELRHTDLEMADLASTAHRLDALEWRAVAQGGVGDDVRRDLAENRTRAETLLDALSVRHQRDASTVTRCYAAYRDAVDREFAAIRNGRSEEAAELDESIVDPAYDRLVARIAEARSAMEVDTRRLLWLSRVGALLGMLAASTMIGFVTWRVHEARRIHDDARHEQDLLRESNERLEQANASLLEASRLKSEFLANMSHELRTPLTSLLGFLELLQQDLCSSPEERREFLHHCHTCGHNLLRLINDLLDMSKIEAGKLSLATERVDLPEIFESVRAMFAKQAEENGVRLSFEPGATTLAARADALRTRQVLVNLVGNSLKFTPHGTITVRATPRPEAGYVRVEVEDTGIGVPRDRQEAVFDPFTQADGSTTRRFGGTGIGLTITRKLTEMMGGVVTLESEGEGRGTRVSFTLPLWEDAPMAAGGETGVVQGPGDGALVLVVDDDPGFRAWVAHQLQHGGFRTLFAGTAEDGWREVRNAKPRVVLIDHALPSGPDQALRSGWDLGVRISSEAATRHVPFVFVTGFDDEIRARLASSGRARPRGRLAKPLDADVLVRSIREVIGVEVPAARTRVLLVDDDPAVGRLARRLLPADRFELECVTGGEECLHRLRRRPAGYDVMLLDLQMPGTNGYDVLRSLALSPRGQEPSVIVLSSAPEPRDAEERHLLEQGAVCAMSKSELLDDPHRLVERIASALAATGASAGAEPDRRAA